MPLASRDRAQEFYSTSYHACTRRPFQRITLPGMSLVPEVGKLSLPESKIPFFVVASQRKMTQVSWSGKSKITDVEGSHALIDYYQAQGTLGPHLPVLTEFYKVILHSSPAVITPKPKDIT